MPANTPMAYHECGMALKPEDRAEDTEHIGEPIARSQGRYLTFVILGGDFTNITKCVVKVRGTNDVIDGGESYTTLKEFDGTTDLAFTDQIDAGTLENGVLVGSIDLDRSPYRVHQLHIAAVDILGGGGPDAAFTAAAYFFSDLQRTGEFHPLRDATPVHPIESSTAMKVIELLGIADDLLSKQHKAEENQP